MANEREIGALLKMAAAVVSRPLQPPDLAETLKAWVLLLSDIEPATLQQAVAKVLQTAEYWPQIPAIREDAARLSYQAEMRQMAEATKRAMIRSGDWKDPPQLEAGVNLATPLNPGVQAIVTRLSGRKQIADTSGGNEDDE